MFYNYNAEQCTTNFDEACCEQHRIEGLSLAHSHIFQVFTKFSNFPMNSGVLSLLISLKTQIALACSTFDSYNEKLKTLFEGEEQVLSSSLPNYYHDNKATRLMYLQVTKSHFDRKIEEFHKEFTFAHFKQDFCNFFRNIYYSMTEPLIFKVLFCF